ncbi:hypothetical protein ACP275_11G107300 [Erythranthe tilingii]
MTSCFFRRETTPLSDAAEPDSAGELESTARPRETTTRRRSTAAEKMPSEAELEQFFAAAENNLHKQFTNKYNYDIVKDQPLEGRYEWIRIQVNLARETLKGLLAHWLAKRRQRFGSQPSSNGEIPSGKEISTRTLTLSRVEGDANLENDSSVYPPFEFPVTSPPSVVTEGSQGGPWRKKTTDLDGTEDEKDFPWWVLDCVLNNRLPPRENTKCSFYLHPCEGSTVQILTQGKLSAPRILRIHKVVNYVIEKMVLDKSLDSASADGTLAPSILGGPGPLPLVGDSSLRSGLRPWQRLKPSIEILCNNQVLLPDMSLATVRAYIWKKPEDLILNYRVVQNRS